ncbi:response regulator [Flaviaesturariibacter amylovorans]|uniref:Acid-responsive two-component system response regulator TcrA n=1 Tax=Flaviaesturariibacter amylovorans TaxID=1084520 RepID=A0ABP8H5R0_9BACT
MTKLIYHIEDDNDYRELVAACLRTKAPRIKIEPFAGGTTAWTVLEALPVEAFPHLILLDLNMPGMNGYEFIRAVRNKDRFANLPIVVFTSSAQASDEKFCADYGVDMITKPNSIPEIDSMLDWILEEKLTNYLENDR